MRILMLDNEFPPLGGGTGVINYHVLKQMAAVGGVEVDLVTSSRTRDQYEQEPFAEGMVLHKVPVHNRNIHHASNLELLRYTWRGYRYSRKLCEQKSYDVSLAWAGVPAGGISYQLWRATRLPYFVSMQGPDVPWYEHRYYWMYPFLKPIILRIWKQAAVVTASSAQHRDLALKSAPNQEIGLIFNGVDPDEFTPGKRAAPKPEAPVSILCAARLIKRKGQADLIRAMKKLKDQGVDGCRLDIAGTGDEEQAYRSLARELDVEDRVQFLGVVERKDMPRLVASADIFAMPSFNEGMSVALLEALASGLPAVVCDTGGTRELVQDNGFVVPWADPETLTEKLKILVQDKAKRLDMGKRSREIAMQYTWRKVAERYLEYCDKAVAANPG